MYRGYCVLNLSHFPHPFSELFIDKDEGGVRFRVLPLGFHAELSFALSAKKEPVPAPDRCRKHCPSTNLCIFDIWTCAYLTYIEMSQTHCLLEHGGEFLFSIVGIFEMPLPPVDELSDDSASKAAIKSPEKPTAPAKPKSKPEKPPKQNPKEKAAKVEKNRRCRKNHRRLRNQRQHPRVNLLPWSGLLQEILLALQILPMAHRRRNQLVLPRILIGSVCANRCTNAMEYGQWSWMGKKWFGSFACIGCLELSLIFLHVTAECNWTATKVKPIDGVDPEEIENIAVPKSWNYKNGDCGLDVFCT